MIVIQKYLHFKGNTSFKNYNTHFPIKDIGYYTLFFIKKKKKQHKNSITTESSLVGFYNN